jgi:tripartite ATP-independent transporter DctM subunit
MSFAFFLVFLISAIVLKMRLFLVIALPSVVALIVETQNLSTISYLISQAVFETPQQYTFSAIPLYLFISFLLLKSDLIKDIFKIGDRIFGNRYGNRLTTLVSCALLSSISGSSTATTMSLASVNKEESNYKIDHSIIISGSTLGIIIPPSIVLIIYSLYAQVGLIELFSAAVMPGIIGLLFYITVSLLWSENQNSPIKKDQEKIDWLPIALVVSTMLGLLLGLYLSLYTIVETAAIGATLCSLILVVSKKISFQDLMECSFQSLKSTAALMIIVISSSLLASYLNLSGAILALQTFVLSFDMSLIMFLFLVAVYFVLAGMFIETISLMLLSMPIFLPLVDLYNIDIVWFGVYITLLLEISLITPPIGMNILAYKSVISINSGKILKNLTPFYIANLGRVLTFIVFLWMIT